MSSGASLERTPESGVRTAKRCFSLSFPFFHDRPRPLHCCFVIRLNFLDEMIGSIDRSLALIRAEFEVHLRFGSQIQGSQILKVMFGVKYGQLVNMCKA